jgi:hypothetical protein
MYASGLVAESGKQLCLRVLTSKRIRCPAEEVSSAFGREGIQGSAYRALSAGRYRARKRKAGKQFSADRVPALKPPAARQAWITNHEFMT